MMNHVSRRKFLKGSAITAAATTGTLAAPVVARAEPAVLKMQAASFWKTRNLMSTACMRWPVRT